MRTLRTGVVAALVAALTCVGLVASSGPAQAVEPRPVDSRTGVLDGLWGVVQDPTTALDLIIGDLNRNGVPDPQEHADMPWMGAAIDKVGGTPAQVQSGEKLASRACKTGWGCLGVLATMIGLVAAGETSDVWGPYIYTRFGEGETFYDSPVSYYAGAKLNGNNWIAADPTGYAYYANLTTSTDRSSSAGDYTWTVTARPPEYECRYGCNINTTIGVDYVLNGQWFHSSKPYGTSIKARWYANNQGAAVTEYNPWTRTTCILNSIDCAKSGIEIRRVHWTGAGGYDKGFYWGQEIVPQNGTLEAVTRCKTPGGDFYDVLGTEPLATGQSPVKACNPGDDAVYVETTTIAPDGTRAPQTSQRLSSPADAAAVFPECAPGGSVYGGCTWSVKVNGVPCAEGSPACVSWASDKSSATCFYGPYQLPLSQCYWLERAYEGGAEPVPGTVPNTDGDPITWDGSPAPSSQPTASPSSSPSTSPTVQPSPTPTPTSTGNPLPTPTPTPTAEPSTNPTPSPTPTPTPTAEPSPSPSPSASPSPSPSASASPSPSSGPSPNPNDPLTKACATSYRLGAVQPEAVMVANEVGELFDVDTIYGFADRGSEHSVGLALDFMTYEDSVKGQAITDYLQENAGRLGVRWIIWEQHVWNVERADEGWRLMEDRGSPTQNHMDHPHVFLYDRDLDGIPGGVSCGGDPSDGGAGGGCLNKAVSWNPVDWVYWPTRCALEWAAIPPPGEIQALFAGVQLEWSTSAPAIWTGELTQIAQAFDYGGGTCQGPALPLDIMGTEKVVYPMNACEGPAATVAQVTRYALTVSFVMAAVYASVQALLSGIGYEGMKS